MLSDIAILGNEGNFYFTGMKRDNEPLAFFSLFLSPSPLPTTPNLFELDRNENI